MQGQDRQAGRDDDGPSSEKLVTVPAELVDQLRQGAFAAIGAAAHAIDGVAFSGKRGAHPEWFRGPSDDLRELCGLLDAIGWEGAVPEVDVRLDPDALPRGLLKALRAVMDTDDAEKGSPR
jgi:hypothetical protein